MILRLKTTVTPKSPAPAGPQAAAHGPHMPAGTRGWQAVSSPDGSTTLWRRRGRVASVGVLRRRES